MSLTKPSSLVGEREIGYFLNALISPKNQLVIQSIQNRFQELLGDGIWIAPAESLHITVGEVLTNTPDIDRVFQDRHSDYDAHLTEVMNDLPVPHIVFDTLKTGASTLYITGRDQGTIMSLRDQIEDRVKRMEGTAPPPDVIHTSIARYTKAIDREQIEKFIATLPVLFEQTLSDLQLIRQTVAPLIEYEVLKRYRFGK